MIGKRICEDDISPALLSRMIKKGMSNKVNNYKVVVAALNKRGELLGVVSNSFRKENLTPSRFAGYHSEIKALHKWGMSVDKMVLMRVGRSGMILPIDCCPKCESILKKCGVRILKVTPENTEKST